MARTGVSFGFPNKNKKKYYDYHGNIRDCNIEPELPPYDDFPTLPLTPTWELIHNDYINITNQYNYVFPYNEFYPDIYGKYCPDEFIDFKRRLYFVEVEVNSYSPGDLWAFHYSQGMNCCFYTIQSTCTWFHLTRFELVWAGSLNLLSFVFVDAVAQVKLWRSSNGQEPASTPLPIFTDHN